MSSEKRAYVASFAKFFTLTAVLAASLGWAIGCSGPSRLDSMDSGRSVSYQHGVPNFDMEVISTIRDGASGLDVYLSIPYISLIFKRGEDGFRSEYELTFQAKDRRGRDVIHQESWREEVVTTSYDQTQAFEFMDSVRRFELDPGEYVVEVALHDLNSDSRAVRRQRVDLFDTQPGQPALSRIRLEALDETGRMRPIVALHVPKNLDSLRAVTHLYPTLGAEIDVKMTLLQFVSDRSVATLPYWLSPNTGSLAYRGINYDRADTLQVTRRTLRSEEEEVEIHFSLPRLGQGNYRVLVDIRPTGDEGLHAYRDLSIKGEEFPKVATIDELVNTLAYVAYERELQHIRQAETVDEKRRRFDAFWGGLVGSREVASNLMRTYYARVEEANMMFSTHKEGWKTDRGMVYIVLGAPLYVERLFDSEVWHYSYTDRDAAHTFVFERIRPHTADLVFDNFILVRRPFLERTWVRAVDRWRSGAVL